MRDMETTEKKRITLRSLWRLSCPARHAVLLISLAWLAASFLLRENRAVMKSPSAKRSCARGTPLPGRLFSAVPFSVTEWVILFLAALGVVLLVLLIVQLIRRRWVKAYRTGMTILSVSAAMFALFCLWWGVLYYSDSFTEQAGLEQRDISVQELETVTRHFAEQANAAGEHVERGEDGVFRADRATSSAVPRIFTGSPSRSSHALLPRRCGQSPCCSALLSYIRYTGFFFPYTAEANLNADSPACLLPSTIAHELAHLRGVAREDEANFCAVVACMESGDEDYRYSGALLAYIYLGNALYRADYDAWREVYSTLSENVRADLRANNDYWTRFETPAADVSEKVYESFLQTYGDDRGMQSYGACVDLLTVYYLDTE